MATYEIETADGATYEIEASDEAQLHAAVAQLMGGKQERPPKQSSKEWSIPNAAGLKQAAGLTARTLTELATDIPTMIADTPAHIVNAFGGGMPYSFAAQRDELLTPAYGRPETDSQTAINFISRGAGGAGLGAGAARFGTSAISQALAARPALQTISGGTGAASAELARQKGVGPVGQAVAGLAGGVLPGLMAPRAPVTDAASLAQRYSQSQAAARAGATAEATPGVAATETAVTAAPEIRIRGGGVGDAGPDPSAGLSVPQQRVAAEGQRLGMRLTPGQATGSRALQQLEAKLESQPMTSGPFNTIKANNARVLQRAAAQSIGEASDTLDDATLARARDRIVGVYESVADDTPRAIDPQRFLATFGEIQADVRGLVKGFAEHPLVEDAINFAQEGQATGRQLQNLASKLGKAANANMTSLNGDRELGLALFRVKDYVDDVLAQGLSGERAQAFDTARQQYRNLMLLTQRVGVVDPAKGTVNPRSLANVLQSKDKGGYLYGQNQTALYNATRFSQAFAPIVGDSGTATRVPFQSIPDMIARIPLNIATRAYTSSPGIRLATGAQAATQAISEYPAGLMGPFGPDDLPYAGIFGAAAANQRH